MKLHFRAVGAGPPVVILHGLLGSLDNWVPFAQRLASQFHVHLLDLRNHGQSPHASEFNYEVMAEDVHEYLICHRIAGAHLLGHSMGGKVAMRFAQLHPEEVRRLVVVDMSPREFPPRFAPVLEAMLAIQPGTRQRREEIDQLLQGAIPDKILRQFLLKNLGRDEAGRLSWKPNVRAIHINYASIRSALPTKTKFAGPTLFVRGELSDYIRDEDFVAIQNLFPDAQFATIPDAGHWVHADALDQCTEVVRQFLLVET